MCIKLAVLHLNIFLDFFIALQEMVDLADFFPFLGSDSSLLSCDT
jgi:hypothetical protein